ncbi:hypothetical protein [Rhizobium sp. NXC24]|uniref:hypothetical protein n=1 Tax=Rhizobium sp. NXC24 TaxID=2048897 RepID=UPI00131A52E1|nr:hypothetical protein [Rhizobium sp. NXC24]
MNDIINTTTGAAALGLPTSRRLFLSALPGLAAASIVPAALISPNVAHAHPEPSLATDTAHENTDLLQAYDRLVAAQSEFADATKALDWIGDEWRHLWPLAPEELLGGANAHQNSFEYLKYAERDIIGRFLFRDTSVLTKRLAREFREQNERQCFHVHTSEEARKRIDELSQYTPKGRTEKALVRNRAWRNEGLAQWKQRLELAVAYEAETARLSEAAGVVPAAQRIVDADAAVKEASAKISMIPAFTHEGLRIKARALQASGLFDGDPNTPGRWGEFCRFIHAVIGAGEEAQV